MLVLSRKTNEVIHIGDTIEVTVISITNDRVRLGVKAPDDVPVHRSEVFEAIRRERSTLGTPPQ